MYNRIYDWLSATSLPESILPAATQAVLIIGIIAIAAAAFFFCRRVLAVTVRRITLKTTATWDEDLLNDRVLSAACQLIPAILVYNYIPDTFRPDTAAFHWISKLCELYIVVAGARLICVFMHSVFELLDGSNRFRAYPMRGIYQMLKLIVICVGVIVGISILVNRDPLILLSGLGASAAVLSLVFKDTIVGLVAGVQLSANNMLKKGDWIVAPRFNADGEVIDVTLTTVKIRNWDNTLSTIPPYALISDSFQNWEAMRDSGVRRVKRWIYIDVNSVRFCTEQQLKQLDRQGMLPDKNIDKASHTVNIGLFREYLEKYLTEHNEVSRRYTILVRQLQPTPEGLPIELYFFTDTAVWKEYERIQSEIFDHIYASVHEFGLRIFQVPGGNDLIRGINELKKN